LGLEPFLVTATLEGIIAQRLVRKICRNCKKQFEPSEDALLEVRLKPEDVSGKKFYYGKGCEQCNNTGYRGRAGIFEIMIFNDELRDLVMKRSSTNLLRAAARRNGMRLLRDNGLKLVYDGITTIEEVARETIAAEE
jgi:type IV pilus assembly protein PilB